MTLEEYSSSEAVWINVQAPIRNMFVALAKTVKEQQQELHSMRELLHKTVNAENVKDTVKMMAMTRTEAADLATSKAGKDDVKSLEIKVEDANKQVARLTQIIQHQTTAITDLNYRLEKANETVESHRKHIVSPNFDAVFKYIDKSVKNGNEEVIERVNHLNTVAAELNDIKRNEKIEDVTRNLSVEMSEQRVLLASKADRDSLAPMTSQILENKQHIENNMAMIESNARNFAEAHTHGAVQPVREHIGSLEKSMVDQDTGLRARVGEVERKLEQEMRHVDEKLDKVRVKTEKMCSDTTLMERVCVETVLRNHWDGNVKDDDMRSKIADSLAATLRETRINGENLRSVVEQETDTKLAHWYKLFENKVDSIRSLHHELEAHNFEAQKKMEELTDGLIKSLQKKANQSDLRALVKGAPSIAKGDAGPTVQARAKAAVETLKKGTTYGGATAGGDADAAGSAPGTTNEEYSQVAAAVLALGQGTGSKEYLEGKIEEVQSQINRLKSSQEGLSLELAQTRSDMDRKPSFEDVDIAVMKIATGEKKERDVSAGAGGKKFALASSLTAEIETAWRMALGDLGTELRKELASKVTKDETQIFVRAEVAPLASQLNKATAAMDSKAEEEKVSKVEQNLAILHSRVVSELTGGLWLWTSRQLTTDGLVPWDSQVVNAAPSSLLWRAGTTGVMVKLPGLYRLSISVFTSLPVAVTILLNDEPLLSIQPDSPADRVSSYANAQGLREERYAVKRLRHSAGDVSAVSVDEPLSLPANATISVRYQSAAASQAFLALRKL